uniref:Uncharacterized protein n=1 Tax=Arion vulgaris TaxID=1028688 RepID=A0A0B6Y4J8_9EUPU
MASMRILTVANCEQRYICLLYNASEQAARIQNQTVRNQIRSLYWKSATKIKQTQKWRRQLADTERHP